jgi:hypothetical protein
MGLLGLRRDALTRTPSIIFHTTVACMFRPLLASSALLSFSSTDSSVEAVLRATTKQLRRLLVMCQLQNPRLFYSTIPFAAIVQVANDALHDALALHHLDTRAEATGRGRPKQDSAEGPDWRSVILLCLTSCGDMSACFPLAESIGRSVLAMGVRDGVLNSRGVHAITEALKMWPSYARSSPADVATGSFAMDMTLFLKEPEAAQVRSLAGQLDDLLMIDEFTTGEL